MSDLVADLQSLYGRLRRRGVTYLDFAKELTYLLYLRRAKDFESEEEIPERLRWDDLTARDGVKRRQFWVELLPKLGSQGSARTQLIFTNASSSLENPTDLTKLVTILEDFDWFDVRDEGLGALFEQFLENNAAEAKSNQSGLHFTTRTLIESIISLLQPQAGEVIQDPAMGTGGFLIYAHQYIKGQTSDLFDLDSRQHRFQKRDAYVGMDSSTKVMPLGVMNLLFHGIEGQLHCNSTLTSAGADLPQANLILCNPPFGRAAETVRREDFTYPTGNRQLAFLQHCVRKLAPGGRAAFIAPDDVLFLDRQNGPEIRRDLMDKCNLHTILRLPTGTFPAKRGVKTNVLFFTRGETDRGNTKAVWFYDLRTNMPSFGKTTPIRREDFRDFETCFGKSPLGSSRRRDQGEGGRFRRLTRAEIAERGDNLDVFFLREAGSGSDDLPSPDELLDEIEDNLQLAQAELAELRQVLDT